MPEKVEEVWVHISSDDYWPHLLKCTSSNENNEGVFEVSRMVMPGNINYFYSINGKAFVHDGKKQISLPEDLHPE